jgi:hypothetical protein
MRLRSFKLQSHDDIPDCVAESAFGHLFQWWKERRETRSNSRREEHGMSSIHSKIKMVNKNTVCFDLYIMVTKRAKETTPSRWEETGSLRVSLSSPSSSVKCVRPVRDSNSRPGGLSSVGAS